MMMPRSRTRARWADDRPDFQRLASERRVKSPILLTVVACLASLPTALLAQAPISLTKSDAEFNQPFTQVGSLRELRDGRVLVVDTRDQTVQLVDFKAGFAKNVGRRGSGPREYGYAARIIALPGDTSAIYDPSNSRYLLITPAGEPAATFRIDEAGGGFGGRGSIPRGTDLRGRIFFEGSAFNATSGGGLEPADSAPVMRYDRPTATIDTVAWVSLAEGNARVAGRPEGGLTFTVGGRAFPARDDWGAMPDGGVAVARVGDYHIDQYSPTGVRRVGPPVKVNPVPVTEAEKEAWREERRNLAGPVQGRGGTPPRGRPPVRRPDPDFPAFLPPFVAGATLGRGNGELWVLRSRKANDPIPVYDVFNSTGSMIGRVVLAPKSRVVGFGNDAVYVVRRDDDDLEYLQRHKLARVR